MNFIYIRPEDIELKYLKSDFSLIWDYIGPNRTHGDFYYNLYWYEITYNYNIVGLICLDFSKFKNTLHLSVFEILEKNKGIGTKTMDFLFEFGKSLKKSYITLQAHNQRAKIFYLRLGFVQKSIENNPYLIKVL